MALPTQQPLNWLQRLAAWLFRIDTDPIIIIRGLQTDAGAPNRHNQRHPNGQWRPAAQQQLTIPKKQRSKGWKKNMTATAVYKEVALKSNWDQIVSHPEWYKIYQLSAKEGKRWRVDIVNRYVKPRNAKLKQSSTRVKSRQFDKQDQAVRFVSQLINIHLSKQGQA